MVVGHDLSQGMTGDGIFEMSKGVRRAKLPAGLSVVCPCIVVSHYRGYRFHFMREMGGRVLPTAALGETIEKIIDAVRLLFEL